ILGPERLPRAPLAAEQGAEVGHRVGPVLPPAHPAPLQPRPHHRLARALHPPRPDLPPLGPVAPVVHPLPLALQLAHHLPPGPPPAPPPPPPPAPARVPPPAPPPPPPPSASRTTATATPRPPRRAPGAGPWPGRPGIP